MNHQMEEQLPWSVTETPGFLSLKHQHLWLGVFGIPFALISASLGVAIWFIPGVSAAREWPILAGGSVIALGFVVMGLHITFNREEFVADRLKEELLHIRGFQPFQRVRRYPLSQVQRVQCVLSKRSTTMEEYELNLSGRDFKKTIAFSVEKDIVLWEGLRWSSFLDLPFDDDII